MIFSIRKSPRSRVPTTRAFNGVRSGRAQVTPHAVTEVLLARCQIGHGGDARDRTFALIEQGVGLVLEIRGQRAVHIAEDGGIGKEVPIVRGLCKGSRRGKKDREESE